MPFSTPSFFKVFLFFHLLAICNSSTPDDAIIIRNGRQFVAGNNSLTGPVTTFTAANATFPPFPFAANPAAPLPNTSSSAPWSWTVNVTSLNPPDADSNTTRIAQTTHTLQFTPPTFPEANATNWTVCAYTFESDLPLNLTSRAKNNNGSCNAVLGEACVAALIAGVQKQSPRRWKYPAGFVCPSVPYWFQIPECVEQVGSDPSTQPALVLFSLQNVTTGSFQVPGNNGTLHSNEVFWSERSSPVPSTNTTPYNEMATRTQFMMLAFAPSNEWIWANGDREGVNARIVENTVVLPMCLRADGGGKAFSGDAVAVGKGVVWSVLGAVRAAVFGGLVI